MSKTFDLKLFVSPGSCARVPTIALEEISGREALDQSFETELVRMNAKQHKSPEFLKINPKGKVPALLINSQPLTENVAILGWLNQTFPEAQLLPQPKTDLDAARQTADLAFFSGTMHPFVTRFARPQKFVVDEEVSEQVRRAGVQAVDPFLTMIDQRLRDQPWWYGDTWSVVDGYLFWIWWRLGASGFSGDKYPNLQNFEKRIQLRPSVARAMEIETKYIEQLKAEELYQAPN